MSASENVSTPVRRALLDLEELDFTDRKVVLVWLGDFFKLWREEPTAALVKHTVAVLIGTNCRVLPNPDLDYWTRPVAESASYAQWLLEFAINALITEEKDAALAIVTRDHYGTCLALWLGKR